MPLKCKLTVVLVTVLVAGFALVSPGYAEAQTLFDKNVSISQWRLHLSHHKFELNDPLNGSFRITKLTPDKGINGGFILFNGRLIFLHDFLTGSEPVYESEVELDTVNHLFVFLRGTPGASLNLNLSTSLPVQEPEIILFDVSPASIKIGQTSTLTWQTKNASACTIDPGGIGVQPGGSRPVSPDRTTTYTLTANGEGKPATATVILTIENSAPLASAQTVATDEDTDATILLTGTDPDGDQLLFAVQSEPAHGILTGVAPDLSYMPASNYYGEDEFSFTVTDGELVSQPATVRIDVRPVNDLPVAAAGSDLSVFVDDMVNLNGSGSMDDDGDPLTYKWSMAAKPDTSQATLSDQSSPAPSFVPDIAGVYEIQLVVHDGTIDSVADSVVVTAARRLVVVPDVVGQILAEAKTVIGNTGLIAGTITTMHHDTVLKDHVVEQAPQPGSNAEEGSPIDLIVSLGPEQRPPTIEASATPEEINQGESSQLTWNAAHAHTVFIDHGQGKFTDNGTRNISPEHTTTYTVTAIGEFGSANVKITVKVKAEPEPQPEGSFGEAYEDLVPADATVDQYDSRRFSVITGEVQNPGGGAIPGVFISIQSHPEYGTVNTDAQGKFSIPIEGGKSYNVDYQKEGLIPSHRQVYVPWNETVIAETVVMISGDSASTTLTFDGDPNTIVTARSSDVTDASGTRAVTMVFAGDNQAYLVDENGKDIQQLTTITARATEYPTPESMPARLPPTSAFTYCAELKVDGAERVRFEKPVVMWVDNFLGFPVGGIVPVGYYDRDKGVWIPSKNGRVVKLLDTDSDGVVDTLDSDGDNLPDDLDGDQIFIDEVQGLEDHQRYTPESTFWRFTVTHFTPFDCNWPFGPPGGAVASNAGRLANNDQKKTKNQDSPICLSSYVEEKSRIFHEDIPIPGTDFTLHYDSSRVAGYKPGVVSIPVSGETVPDSLVRIIVEVQIAGRSFEWELPPLPNQTMDFEWDGLDHLGQPVTGPVVGHIRIGFVYYGVYYSPSSIGRSFGQPGVATLTVPTRQEVTLWKATNVPIIRGKGTLAEGWTLSPHHQLYRMDPSFLFKGDGTINRNSVSIIETYAGTGSGGYSGDGGPAVDARISRPYGLDIDAFGNLYIADINSGAIRKVDMNGIISTFSGSTTADIAVDGAGNLFYPNGHNFWVDYADGTTKRLAGDYHGAFSGDGGPASKAQLNTPYAGDVDAGGNVYIADRWNQRIRKIDTSGIITTVAGNGLTGNSGDGGPAIAARLQHPKDVLVDASGNIYIASSSRVRKVDPSGIITTLAGGGGSYQNIGDGGPANKAYLGDISALVMDDRGNLFIAESERHRVRKVNPNGIISTVAGDSSGVAGYRGDGGPPAGALLKSPRGLAVDADGNVYISDSDNHRIRVMKPPTPALAGLMDDTDFAFTEESGVAFILSGAGRHKKTVDLNTGIALHEFGYDENNRLVSISDQFGNETRIERDVNGVPTAIVSADGIRTKLTIDAGNHLKRIAYPGNRFYDFEYTPDGLATLKTEPEKNRFLHAYDANGRLTDSEDEEGGHWQFARTVYADGPVEHGIFSREGNDTFHIDTIDATGVYASTTTTPDGSESRYTESADGLNASRSLPCGMLNESTYAIDPEYKFKYLSRLVESTPSGLRRVWQTTRTYTDETSDKVPDIITEQISVNGKTTALTNSILTSLKTVTSPEGRAVKSYYNPGTLVVEKVTIPGLYDTEYAYDDRGRLSLVRTNTRETKYSYDAKGFLDSVTDPENKTTFYDYDEIGRLSAINRPDGGLVDFGYDANGNLAVMTIQETVDHGFGANKVNLKNAYHTPISGSYEFKYDRDRRLNEIIFPSQKKIVNTYLDGVLDHIRTPGGNIDFTYACGGKVESMTNGNESIAYGYDGKLLTSETLSGTLDQIIAYKYNQDFNLESIEYAGAKENFSYDDDGLLTGAGAFTIERNTDNGLPESVTDSNWQLTRGFNMYAEVDQTSFGLIAKELASWDLKRDHNGRITEKTESIDGPAVHYQYEYDDVGRLTKVFKDGTLVEEYRYNRKGIRTYEMNALRGINTKAYEYSEEDHLLKAGSTVYEYDLDGFLTKKINGTDTTTYSYSIRGELLRVELPDGRDIEYVHDPLGRRIAKKINGAIVQKYLWQGMTQLLAVYDGLGNLLMRFEYADDRVPLAMLKEGVRYYLIHDQVGSLRAVADGGGNVVKRIEYDSFGNVLADSNLLFEVPFGFAGGLYDRDTGLVRFGHRDYDPDVGCWTAKDPILFAGGDTDLYGYVLNDPINFIDPEGLALWGGGVKVLKWVAEKGIKWATKKLGKEIGKREGGNPMEQQEMDTDTDGDGTSDAFDPDSDWDSDGIPNISDQDDDNDGIPDGMDYENNNVPVEESADGQKACP